MDDTEKCKDRDWIYNYCRWMGWDVEMGRHIQTRTDILNNNDQIQTGKLRHMRM